jgi:hypothetical protein
LGALAEVSPAIVENFFAEDLNYLQDFYRRINGLQPESSPSDFTSENFIPEDSVNSSEAVVFN